MALGTEVNDLCDPGFEDPSACWQAVPVGEPGSSTAAITSENPRTGTYSADLCSGAESCADVLQQHVPVPENLESATIGAWLAGTSTGSEEDCSNLMGVVVPVFEQPGFVAGAVECSSSMDSVYSYYEMDVTSTLSDYQGGSAPIWAFGQTQQGTSGTYYIDDASLTMVTGEAPPETTVHKRGVTLSLSRHLQAKGDLSLDAGGPGACVKQMTVNLQRKVGDTWKKVDSDTTNAEGLYALGLLDKPGKYRAVAPKVALTDTRICGKAVSAIKTHKH